MFLACYSTLGIEVVSYPNICNDKDERKPVILLALVFGDVIKIFL